MGDAVNSKNAAILYEDQGWKKSYLPDAGIWRRKRGCALWLARDKEAAEPEPYLHGIDSRIRGGQSCIRDVHITEFETQVVLRPEDVRPERRLVHEVHRVRSCRYTVIGEDDPAGEFKIRRKPSMTSEIPLQAEGIETNTEGRICRLEDEEKGDGVDRIFETSAKKSGQVFVSQNPAIAQSSVEGAGIAPASRHRMSASSPNLDFVATPFRADLST